MPWSNVVLAHINSIFGIAKHEATGVKVYTTESVESKSVLLLLFAGVLGIAASSGSLG